ncbi:SoxR reducing system RseC family protein [Aliivibrio fischeri]|uniref:SoxR reducing system RseC family protein n=1 Tax=Aliivibrio fischeri TaxID=668 RepID=UPI001F3CB5AF|nr:SoxR reducing system RseC family protein [Aliivibrio fischeri]MCE7576591.1 SoxR reducing system RseC family protein [Aliivibrio fischeri]MCE7589286.1 SoxR reducing system RseC family protein [Aliivibrio fischeri]
MMTALATVLEVQEDIVVVGCQQKTSCNHCSSKNSCGTGIVSKALPGKVHHWAFHTEKKLSVGQLVEIGLPEKNLLQSAAIVYLTPLLFLLFGALLSEWFLSPMIGLGELTTIVVSVLFALGGYQLAKRLSHHIEQKTEQQVSLLRVLGEPVSDTNLGNAAR